MDVLEQLLDLQEPDDITISPDGTQVIYTTQLLFGHRRGKHPVCTIWLATIDESNSTRKLTTGLFNDHSPAWSPDGESVAFLSDRRVPGEADDIYILPLSGGEAYAAASSTGTSVERFTFSPDGNTIAFLSPDDTSHKDKAKQESGVTAQVWGEEWPLNRLRLLKVNTGEVSTLVSMNAHIDELAWSDDGESILFTHVKDPDVESPEIHGTTFCVVNLEGQSVRQLFRFPNRGWDITLTGQEAFFLGSYNEASTISATAVYRIHLGADSGEYSRHSYGKTECVSDLRRCGDDIVAGICRRMNDELVSISRPGLEPLYSRKQVIMAWGALLKTGKPPRIVIAASTTNSPAEVYSISASGTIRLSSHGSALSQKAFGTFTHLSCPSLEKSFTIDSVWVTPNTPYKGPFPTLIYGHGGPYHRESETFDPTNFMWGPFLLSQGYALLIPNYRGSSGQGEVFAAEAHGLQGAGTTCHNDMILATQHAIEQGLADPERLVFGGWSQGGFLAYLAAVRNGTHGFGWRYRGVIAGAGVCDADALVLTSDFSIGQADCAGLAPWKCRQSDVVSRESSAIWQIQDAVDKEVVIPPVLILHGEMDKRCPVEQAHGFRRAMRDHGLDCQCVIYQAEGHILKQRGNLLDIGSRVLDFIDKCVGRGS